MAKVLLISCNECNEPYPVYPLGMAIVAEAVRERGHKVTEWDLLASKSSMDSLQKVIEEFKPDSVGISLRNIDNINSHNLISYLELFKKMIRELREMTRAPLILGGSAFSIFPEEILKETKADYGITGQGETSFVELIELLAEDKKPENRILTGKAPPLPLRHPRRTFAEYYKSKGGMLNIQTKRGCPFKCAYCNYPLLEGQSYRFRSPVEVADELEFMKDTYNTEYVFITDSVFNDQQGHCLKIAEEIARRKLGIRWMGYFRPQKFSVEDVALLKESGLSAVEWGSDASTDTTLAGMQKGFSWETVEAANNLFTDSGIPCAHFIIFGGPGETPRTVIEGLENINKLKSCVIFASIGIRILPNTKIQEIAIKEKIISPEQNLLDSVFYLSPETKQEFLHNAILKSFEDKPSRIYPWDKIDPNIIKMIHLSAHQGPAWDFLLKPPRRKRAGRGSLHDKPEK